MGTVTDVEIKRWTARRKSPLVLEIIQGKATVAEASRAYDLPPSELEAWIEDGKRGMRTPFERTRRIGLLPVALTPCLERSIATRSPSGRRLPRQSKIGDA